MRSAVGDLLVTVVVSTYLAASVCATKILLVPGNLDSHVILFSRLGVELAKLGDVVTVIAPSSTRIPDFVADDIENFTYLSYPVDKSAWFANKTETLIARAMISSSPIQVMRMFAEGTAAVTRVGEQNCIRLLDNAKIMPKIRTAGYDFAIMDMYGAIACYYTIPYSLGIPYATLSLVISSASIFRVPRLASFPNMASLSDRTSFLDRLTTFIIDMMDHGIIRDNRYYMEKYVPNRPYIDTVEIFRQQSLWFFLEDLSVQYPLPQMPNTIAVGDLITATTVRPLSGDIKDFISRSKHGVIIVSFGSIWSDALPPAIIRRLCETLSEATNRFRVSVVWQLNAEASCPNESILILPWIPQNDLLADSRVKLFISHGGFNSVMESVYHAKPLLILPIGADQPANAAAAVSKGFAIQMKILDFSVESLTLNIGKLLTEPSYKRRVELASAIMRDRRDTAAQRVSFMIDHVVKYGDRHLCTGAFELSTFQFMMFDIFAVLVAAAVLVLFMVTLLCYCV